MNYRSKQLEEFIVDLSPEYKEELELIIKEKEPKNRSETDRILSEFRREKKFIKIGKFTVKYWTQRGWSLSEANLKKSKKIGNPTGTPMQETFWINKINPDTGNKYTEEEAKYKIRSQRKFNTEYWIERGYNLNQAIENVQLLQKENAKKLKDSLINNPNNSRTWTQISYWKNKGFTEKEAKNKISALQKMNDINTLINKYGDIEGRIRYDEISKKISYSLTLEYHIEKYGEVEGNIKYRRRIESITKFYRGTSKESISFFIPLYKKIRKYLNRNDIFWGIGSSNEYFIWDKDIKRIFFYDFCIPKHKIIIEFHGIHWHPNPRWNTNKLKKWHLFGMNYEEKMRIDNYKKELAEKNGFKIFEVYSDEKEFFDFNIILDLIKK
jgi:hypothetical protein